MLIWAQLTNLVEKQQPFICHAQQTGALACGSGESAFFVAKQGRSRPITAQGGAVDIDKIAADLVPGFFQLKNSPRQHRLASAGGPSQQQRRFAAHCHSFQLGNQRVKAGVAGGDAAFEKSYCIGVRYLQPGVDAVVAGQVEVNAFIAASACALSASGRRGLQQHAGNKPCLDQQKQANLRHMRAGGDVYPIVFLLGVKRVAACPVVKRAIHLAKIPRIGKVHHHPRDIGGGRELQKVLLHPLGHGGVADVVQQFQPVDLHIFMLRHRHRGPPFVPAIRGQA